MHSIKCGKEQSYRFPRAIKKKKCSKGCYLMHVNTRAYAQKLTDKETKNI
jgi:hypothetical protein